jgi:hypothetical protein
VDHSRPRDSPTGSPVCAYIMIHMTVNVRTDTNSDNQHASADRIDVHDGHLFVQQVSGTGKKTRAIYAPGRWHSAKIEEETAKP